MGIAALAVSCTNEDFQNVEQEVALNASENVVFTVAGVDSRGEFNYGETGFYTGWNAEDDRIGVIASGVTLPLHGTTPQTTANANVWNFNADATRNADTSSEQALTGYVYKATKSGSVGVFTSVNDDNLLKFAPVTDPQTKASFRVFRPATASVTYDRTDDVETMAASVPAFNAQTQTTTKANFDNFFMVADPIDGIHSSKNAVGESMALSFTRPFAALAIKTTGFNQTIFGNLKSVTVAGTSTLAYTSAISVDIAKKVDEQWAINAGSATASNSVTLTVGNASGLEWSDNNYAYIQVMPVDRSEMPVAEEYTVTLTFTNGSVTIDKSTTNSWEPNDFIRITCDLTAEDYLYFDTNKSLLVNNAMPTVAANGKFEYGNSEITATTIQTVVSNKVLTANELAELNKMTGVTSLTLPNEASDLGEDMENIEGLASLSTLNLTETLEAPAISADWAALATLSCPKATSIPDAAYQNNNVITSASFPLVQTIGDDAFNGATNITTIGCAPSCNLVIGTTTSGVKSSALTSVGSFAFAGISGITSVDAPELATIGSRAFGTSALASLTSVLLPKYDYADSYNAIALLGGSALVTVNLSSVSELGIETIAFAGNTALTTVTLKDGVNVGKMAFKGCTALATVTNLDKAATIGESAFDGCIAIAKTLLNASVIGKNAFKGATSLATVTLGADVTTIDEGAFDGCSALGTVNNLANIESIGKNAFKNTAVEAYNFLNATLGEGAFYGVNELKGHVRSNVEVLEKNVFYGANKVSTFTFPEVTTIKEGALASLLATSPYVTITFGSALTSIDAKAFCTPSGTKDGSTVANAITGSVNYNLILADKTGLTISGTKVTYQATDGKYYAITFASVQ